MFAVTIAITGPECQTPAPVCGSQLCVLRRQRVPGSTAVNLHTVYHLDFLQTQGCTNIVSHFMNILIVIFCPLLFRSF